MLPYAAFAGVGAGVTALAAGWSRTAIGSYNDAFVTSGARCLIGSILVFTIARRPRFEAATI